MSGHKAKRGEAHVRLYRHELECTAYRSLSTDARALLIEFRALFTGRENQVFMSLGEIQRRVGVGRWRAEKARNELLDRGFVRLLNPGSFTQKTRHAPTYALTNVPLNPQQDGATPTKDFMKWTSPQKNTVLATSTDGVSHQHRGTPKTSKKSPHGVGHQHRESIKAPPHGVGHQHTDKLPGSPLVWGAVKFNSRLQYECILAGMILADASGAA